MGDVHAMVALLEDGYCRSRYRDLCGFDVRLARSQVFQAVQRHGLMGAGGQCVFVGESAGVVVGMIVGVLQPLYMLGDKLEAADVFFVVRAGAHPDVSRGLLDSYVAWAVGNPDVVEVTLSVTDVIGSPERVARLYDRMGFRRKGVISGRTLV